MKLETRRMRTGYVRQPPVRNESVVGSHILSHSGEFAPRIVDFVLGRGVWFEIVRRYRSLLAYEVSDFGRGWSPTSFKSLTRRSRR